MNKLMKIVLNMFIKIKKCGLLFFYEMFFSVDEVFWNVNDRFKGCSLFVFMIWYDVILIIRFLFMFELCCI